MNIKKRICILIPAALLLCTACGAFGEAAEPDYYRIGLKVTALMSEMMDSEAFLSILTRPEYFSEVLGKVNTHDYDRPVAVYSVTMSDPMAFLEWMFRDEEEVRELWDSLSPALQEQLLMRIGIQTLGPLFNSRAGSEYLSLFNVATAVIQDEGLTAQKSCVYLYVFEEGVPILVSFGYRAASGSFFYIPKESRGSLEDIIAYLAVPCVEIVPVETGDVSASDGAANLAAHGVDKDEAAAKMGQAIGERLPASAKMSEYKFELFDVTGDGCADLCTCVTWGSGMVRTDLVVYDPLEDALYVLDGYNYNYLIDHIEADRIVIVKEGPYGYNDPITKTYGTVRLENRELIFEPDAGNP